MKTSRDGINFLIARETVRLKPYDDKTRKTITEYIPSATIGIGHLILKDEWNQFKNGIPMDIAMRLLKHDLSRFESAVDKNIKKALNQNQYDAVVIFVFNIGVTKFLKSSAFKLINNPRAKTNYLTLESAWKAYNKDDGVVKDGLVKRRALEWELYLMPEGI